MTDPVTGPEADARRAALLAQINGTPLPAAAPADARPSFVATGVPERSYEDKVLSRLTAIAAFTGILAVLAIISLIVSIAAAAVVAGR